MPEYTINSADQGEEALNMARQAEAAGEPYAVVLMCEAMLPCECRCRR